MFTGGCWPRRLPPGLLHQGHAPRSPSRSDVGHTPKSEPPPGPATPVAAQLAGFIRKKKASTTLCDRAPWMQLIRHVSACGTLGSHPPVGDCGFSIRWESLRLWNRRPIQLGFSHHQPLPTRRPWTHPSVYGLSLPHPRGGDCSDEQCEFRAPCLAHQRRGAALTAPDPPGCP